MKLGIMQPYIFPYIGYFQLINAVDRFVIYDNIEYTKKGWINRNRILQNNLATYFTIPLKKDSDYLNVNERIIAEEFNKQKLLAKIQNAYKFAPFFNELFTNIKEIIEIDENNLFKYIHHSIQKTCNLLGINTEIILSSNLSIEQSLKGVNKVLAICKANRASTYINSIGGKDLYNKEDFIKENIELRFLKSSYIKYNQFENEFIPWLSIIDVMMFNSKLKINNMLGAYTLN